MPRKSIIIKAPAKINLTLEVLGKRPDGYHEIRSVIQTVSLCDELTFENADQTSYHSDMAGWSGEKSLIAKAVALLRDLTGEVSGVKIDVMKKIPLASGLGGDSSDAAATLKGLNALWELNLSNDQMIKAAAQLGSDVPFFLTGGTALMEGRGEKITALASVPESWFILVIPDVQRPPRKTQALYGALTQDHFTDGSITNRFLENLRSAKALDPELLFNTFENVTFRERSDESDRSDLSLRKYRDHILKMGVANLHLAGSGPAMFAPVSSKKKGKNWLRGLLVRV